MVTLKDVAKKAGVSEATVSLALNDRPGVNKQTRSRVLAISREMGYSPNSIARSLAMKKSSTIGLVVTDIENPFYGSAVHFLSEHAQKNNYSLLMAASNEDLQLEEDILNMFMNRQVDGIIIIPSQKNRTDYSIFSFMDKRKLPYVFTVSYYPKYNNDYVLTDYKTGSYRLTKYLLDLGHRKILHLVGSNTESPINRERLDGYFQAFREASVEIDKKLILTCRQPDFLSGYEQTKNTLEQIKPDAVIAINDILAIGARKAISERGYKIPEDISLAGYDDVIFASLMETPLTTVKQDIEQIARKSIELLIHKINSTEIENSRILIQPDLIIRETTGPRLNFSK